MMMLLLIGVVQLQVNTFWLVLYLLSTTYTLGVVILIYWHGYS